jgi:hypothetical protein
MRRVHGPFRRKTDIDMRTSSFAQQRFDGTFALPFIAPSAS